MARRKLVELEYGIPDGTLVNLLLVAVIMILLQPDTGRLIDLMTSILGY